MSQSLPVDAPIPVEADPFVTIESWLLEAAKTEPDNPDAMSVATVDDTGMPNVRMLLMKGIDKAGTDGRGFVFYTNAESTKGRELETSPKAALLFHWKSLGRQIRIRGEVSAVSEREADGYFASRPLGSRIGAWASDQSRPLESREVLEKRVVWFTEKFGGRAVERPPHWRGYRVTPLEIEFWKNGSDRLHDRLMYARADVTASWTTVNLYP